LTELKVCLVPLTHETKYASGTMKFVDLLEFEGSSDPPIPPSYELALNAKCYIAMRKSDDCISAASFANKCIEDDTKAAARRSPNCIRKTKKIKYGEKRFSIRRIEFSNTAMWYVALGS